MAEHRWPAPPQNWASTRDTLHLWTQVVGKVRLAHTPLANHWWNVALYVTARGLTTSAIPHPRGHTFQVDFDFVDHEVVVTTAEGNRRSHKLEPQTVAEFYRAVMAMLDDLDVSTPIWTRPVEIPDVIPFEEDDVHSSYDPAQVRQFWRVLLDASRVFDVFRSRYVGKVSPVHFFWGAFDLAVTRFSGAPAPVYGGSVPNCAPYVMVEAYSHEVSSCGLWPASDGQLMFYSYSYPERDGFRDLPVEPARAARYDGTLGEFLLPYDAVRQSADPDNTLLAFLQTTYEAAATTGRWDRSRLERAT